MIHHGQTIFQIARMKGYNKSMLARELGKTSQAVDRDVKQEVLNIDTLGKYAQILNVKIEDLQNSNQIPVEGFVDYKEKYFSLLEETKKLWQVISQNNIKVDLGKFEVINWHVVSRFFFVRTN